MKRYGEDAQYQATMRADAMLEAGDFEGQRVWRRTLKAIHAATKLGGELFGADIGLIKEGYLADILLVEGDPAKDVTIMKDGGFCKAPAGGQWQGVQAAE